MGNVVTFLDRHRRTVFFAVTELRRATKASSPTARPADGACVSCAGLRLIKAGPTGGATMQQVELSVSFVLRATCSDIRAGGRRVDHTAACPWPGPTTARADTLAHDVRGPTPLPAGGKLFRPTLPPLLTTRPGGASNNPPENTAAPRGSPNRRPPQDRDLGLEQSRDRAPATPGRHTFPDVYTTADDLAAVRLNAGPDATGPRSQTIRGLLGGACAGWRIRPTSVEI